MLGKAFFVSNWAFLCRTRTFWCRTLHFTVEPGFFVSNECYNYGPMVVLVCFVFYSTLLSSLCRHVWRYWTSKILVRYTLSSVYLRLSKISQSSLMEYMGLCISSLHISLKMTVRMCVPNLIIIIKSYVWPIRHCLELNYETMVCAVCLSIFIYIDDILHFTDLAPCHGHYKSQTILTHLLIEYGYAYLTTSTGNGICPNQRKNCTKHYFAYSK